MRDSQRCGEICASGPRLRLSCRREDQELSFSGLLICNDPLRVASMTLINSLVSSSEDLDFRIHLRNEIMRIGLRDVLEVTVCNTRNLPEGSFLSNLINQ